MQYNTAKKVFSAMTVAGMVFSASPVAFASGVRIVNNNSADVSTVVSVSAISGSNTSRGGEGGAGGELSSSGDLATDSTVRGTTGMGGRGGNGGDIKTGEAIGTATVKNDINTTETNIQDSDKCDEESLDQTSSVGKSLSGAFDTSANKAMLKTDSSTVAILDSADSSKSDTLSQMMNNTGSDQTSKSSADSLNSSDTGSDFAMGSMTASKTSGSNSAMSDSASDSSNSTSSSSSDLDSSSDAASDSSASTQASDQSGSESMTGNKASDSSLGSSMASTLAVTDNAGETAASAFTDASSKDTASNSADSKLSTNDKTNNSLMDSSEASKTTKTLATEEHNNTALHKHCVRNSNGVGIEVLNSNTATPSQVASVSALSGDNLTVGASGAAGGALTNDSSVGTSGWDTTADTMNMTGNGADGGHGGAVTSGRADSLTDIVNVTGRTITRVVRN